MKSKLLIFKSLFVFPLLLGTFSISHAQNGSLDGSFGTNGIAKIYLNQQMEGAYFADMVTLPDDKIVVIGSIRENVNNLFIAQFTVDGQLDTTFGNMGISEMDPSLGGYDNGMGLDVQSDGKIVFTGSSIIDGNLHVLVGRLDANGVFDDTFANFGTLLFSPNNSDYGYNVDVASDGKILISATAVINNMGVMTIYRLDSNGDFDLSFGVFGTKNVTVVSNLFPETPTRLTVGSDNSVYMVGYNGETPGRGLICKLDANGQLDNTFAGDGTQAVQMPTSELRFNDVVSNEDGALWIVGTEMFNDHSNTVLFKIKADGQLDNAFGQNGKITVVSTQSNESADGFSIYKNGNQILVCGDLYQDGADHVITAMYNVSGIPNNNYGTQGISKVKIFEEAGSYYNMSVNAQSFGKIIIAGDYYLNDSSTTIPWVARLQNNIQLDIHETLNNEIELTVFPNPASHYFQIKSADVKVERVSLVDVSGRMLQAWSGNLETYLLNENISKGNYFIRVETANGITHQSLIIQ